MINRPLGILALSLAPGSAAPAFAQEHDAAWAMAEQARGEALFQSQDFLGAEAAHRAALEVRTRSADPIGWAESTASAGRERRECGRGALQYWHGAEADG